MQICWRAWFLQTPRKQPASGNRLRESLQNFESLSKTIQFTKVCELASFWHGVEAGMSYKTIPDVDDGFGALHPSMPRIFTFSRRPRIQSVRSDSRRNIIWTNHRSAHRTTSWQPWTWKFKRNLRRIRNEHPGLWYVQERIGSWTKCMSQIQDTISPVQNYLRNEQLQQKVNFVLQNWSYSALGKLVPDRSGLLLIQRAFR